jgi:mercuric ion transport protein
VRDGTVRSASLLGALGASVAASICCIGPVMLALLGLGGAGLLVKLDPYRPYLMVATFGLLGLAFVRTYRQQDCDCAEPRAGRRSLWFVTSLALLMLASPYLLPYLL